VVAILRGGGGEVGLSCYNQYPLAAGVATFPLPVITGIGHATNETVTERVAYFNAITPTRLAQFVTGYFDNAYQLLLQHEEKLTRNVIENKSLQYQQLLHCNDRLVKATNQQVKSEQHQLEHVGMTIRREGRYRMNTETERWQYVANDLLKYSTQFLQEQRRTWSNNLSIFCIK
jgi:exodeoxyribonuclease VII large subunit